MVSFDKLYKFAFNFCKIAEEPFKPIVVSSAESVTKLINEGNFESAIEEIESLTGVVSREELLNAIKQADPDKVSSFLQSYSTEPTEVKEPVDEWDMVSDEPIGNWDEDILTASAPIRNLMKLAKI